MNRSSSPACLRATGPLLLALALGACGAVQSVAEAPGKMTKALLPQAAPDKRPITDLHPEILRLGDFALQQMRQGTAEFDAAAGTPEAHVQAVAWRLQFSNGILQHTTGPVPLLGFLDALVASKAGRLIFEDHYIPEIWGEAARPMVDAFVSIEDRIWEKLPEFFSEEQIAGLRETLSAWEQEQRGEGEALRQSMPTFREVSQAMSAGDKEAGGFLGFIRLDPLAGLEPVAREVALTRQFAERLLFWSERLPMVLGLSLIHI